jgi:uncharacterized protein (DUF1330 family)
MSSDELVGRLVALHGEQGVCPTAAGWRAILAVEGPLYLLTLLAFVRYVDVYSGPHNGAWDYEEYHTAVGPALLRAGGRELYFGDVGHQFGTSEPRRWDAAVLIRYPSARALADMWLDPEFVAVHRSQVSGVAESEVLVFAG